MSKNSDESLETDYSNLEDSENIIPVLESECTNNAHSSTTDRQIDITTSNV